MGIPQTLTPLFNHVCNEEIMQQIASRNKDVGLLSAYDQFATVVGDRNNRA